MVEWSSGSARARERVRNLGDLQGYLQRSTQQSSAAGRMGSALSRHAHCAAGAAQPALPEHDQVGRRGCLQRLPADPVLDSLREQQPRVLFVGYGETDNWGHAGRYDLLLHSAHLFDHFVEELWHSLQGLPAYRDQTTFIITTDHGRGSGPIDWKEHGVEQPGSENIWIAVLGPDTRALGERTHTAP